jgi:hypothetical protein
MLYIRTSWKYAVALACVLYPTFLYISRDETEQKTCPSINVRDQNIRYILVGASGATWINLLIKIVWNIFKQKNISLTTNKVNFVVGALMSIHFVSEILLLVECSTNIDMFGIVSPKFQYAEWASTVPIM